MSYLPNNIILYIETKTGKQLCPITYDQFIARVHRLTSRRPVTIYVVMAEGTVDERKWELINQKGAASQLALDGTLFHQDTEKIDLQQVLDELKRRGISSDAAIPEDQIRRQWYPQEESTARTPSPDSWSVTDTSSAVQLSLL